MRLKKETEEIALYIKEAPTTLCIKETPTCMPIQVVVNFTKDLKKRKLIMLKKEEGKQYCTSVQVIVNLGENLKKKRVT